MGKLYCSITLLYKSGKADLAVTFSKQIQLRILYLSLFMCLIKHVYKQLPSPSLQILWAQGQHLVHSAGYWKETETQDSNRFCNRKFRGAEVRSLAFRFIVPFSYSNSVLDCLVIQAEESLEIDFYFLLFYSLSGCLLKTKLCSQEETSRCCSRNNS